LANEFGLHPAALQITFAVGGENLIFLLAIDLDLQMRAELTRAITIEQRCNNVARLADSTILHSMLPERSALPEMITVFAALVSTNRTACFTAFPAVSGKRQADVENFVQLP